VLSPAEALARAVSVAGVDTTKAAVAVVSVHSRGGVIAIVSGGAVLTSRAFTWPLGSPSARSGSELLDRYVTVSQLAPMLKHFIELARPVYGVDTTSIYMCGTTGELRSLSMLLIEELDLDVETLDSADRLGPTYPEALGGAAAFQLAAAAALPRVETRQEHVEARERNAPGRSASRPIATLSAVLLAVLWSSLQLSGSSPATPFPSPAAAILADQLREPPVIEPWQPEATMGRVGALPVARPAEEAAPSVVGTAAPRRERATGVVTARLPNVDGIMISGERRLAIVDGIVVAPGDSVAGRLVTAIDRGGIVLREPSGRELRVAIRARKPGPAGTPLKPQP